MTSTEVRTRVLQAVYVRACNSVQSTVEGNAWKRSHTQLRGALIIMIWKKLVVRIRSNIRGRVVALLISPSHAAVDAWFRHRVLRGTD